MTRAVAETMLPTVGRLESADMEQGATWNGEDCPFCGAHETDFDIPAIKGETDEVLVNCWCEQCDNSWVEVYKLSHAEILDDEGRTIRTIVVSPVAPTG